MVIGEGELRWRDIIIGAIVALFVTIVGGIIVYYVTGYRSSALEKLVYQVEKPTLFETKDTKVSLVTVRAGNVGDRTAEGVNLVISFDEGTTIIDKKVRLSSEPTGTYVDRSKGKTGVHLFFPNLVPSETATVSIMLAAIVKDVPIVGIRSATTVGEPGSFVRDAPSGGTEGGTLQRLLSRLIPLIGGGQVLLLAMLSRRFRSRLRRFIPTFPSVNNTAFLYIHSGMVDEALGLLQNEVIRRGADAVTLANYGLALGLNGDREGAEKRLRAAEWWAQVKHERAVVAFNRAILALFANDIGVGRKYLREALQLSSEIRRYCNLSIFVKKAAEQDQEIAALVSDGGAVAEVSKSD